MRFVEVKFFCDYVSECNKLCVIIWLWV